MGLTLNEDAVEPVFQTYVFPPLTEMVLLCPEQMVAGLAFVVSVKLGLMDTVVEAVPVQPPLVTVTV